jgi:multidrug efflux pump
VGLVSKNGILIVQFANHLQQTGMDKLSAIIEASGTRLRPILMTTAATVVGHFPLVLAIGPGAGARNSIGIMLVSGMVIGTLFTLFVVPSIYILVARRHSPALGEEIEVAPLRLARPERRHPSRAWTSARARTARAEVEAAASRM